MHVDAIDERPGRRRALLALAVLLSVGAHVVVAGSVARIERPTTEERVWAEMIVVETPPPVEQPPEPPPPPPEPPKPRPVPQEVVDFEETTTQPPPDAPPPPDRKPVRRLVQGLSNDSFVEGPTTGLQVSAGNTAAARQTKEKVDPETIGEFQQVAYERVTTAPKLTRRPMITAPETEAFKAANVSGSVKLSLVIGADGKVLEASVVQALHPDADAACVRDVKLLSRWAPGTQEGSPVTVRGVPYTCTYLPRD